MPASGEKVVSTFVPGNLNELIMCFDLLNNLPEVNAIQSGLRRQSDPGPASDAPYAQGAALPRNLEQALADGKAERGITVGRSYVGEYCTSLDIAGASITLVKLDDEIERLLAAPAEIAIRTF